MRMNFILKLFVFLSIALLNLNCASTPPTTNGSSSKASSTDTSVITDDGDEYQIDNLEEEEIGIIVEKLAKGDAHDSLILLLHGRGRHPEKALMQIIPKLKKEYKAAVIMFHWSPSYTGKIGYPDNHAKEAGEDFGKALKIFNDYKKEKGIGLKSVLLVHSMGNIVFQSFMDKYNGNMSSDLFDTVVLNAADVDAKGHANYLNKVDFTDNLYVTVNKHDKVLGLSAKRNRKKRLGQKIKDKVELSSNQRVKYVNFDNADVNHRYYLKKGQNGNQNLSSFYGSVLKGKSMDLDHFDGIGTVEREKIYVFK